MKITVELSPDGVAVIFEAEGQAELFQLSDLRERLWGIGAKHHEWNDMHGKKGLTVVAVNLREDES